MKIRADFNGFEEKFAFDSPEVLERIFESCPTIKKLFRELYSVDSDGNVFPGIYIINHDDQRLRKGMSEIDKFKGNLYGADLDALIYRYTLSFRTLIHGTMYKKKNIKVTCRN